MDISSVYLNKILSDVVRKNISSLHFTVGSKPVIRLEGNLVELDEDIINKEGIEKILNFILDQDEQEKLKQEKELVVVKNFEDNNRFRINIFFQKNFPSLSFNFIPKLIRPISELNLPRHINEAMFFKSGLLIVAGPRDSGKTSVIASLIEEINKKAKKYIITLEDPIEYIFINKKSVIEQRQIGGDTQSYVSGLNHCLREDVDVVYIDEIKGDISLAMKLILELASGNALVIMEMNAENSIGVIDKLLSTADSDRALESLKYQISDVLKGVISLKLFPRRGGGQVLAKEIMTVNSAVKSVIREGKHYQLESIIQTSKGEGMLSMSRSIEELLNFNKISGEDAGFYNYQN